MYTARKICALLLTTVLALSLPNAASAAAIAPRDEHVEPADTVINAATFPDDAFRAVVADRAIDTNLDGLLTEAERDAVTTLSLDGLGITTLKGIENFPALETLNCADNALESLDLQHNAALVQLNCSDNRLTALDLSAQTALTELLCTGNQLTSLDLSAQSDTLYAELSGNRYNIRLDDNRQFDLSTLPGDFDSSRMGNLSGARADGDILTVGEGVSDVTYTYNTGASGSLPIFTLHVDESQPPAASEYTITFDSTGGNTALASATTEGGKLTSLPMPSRDGYTFLGWFTAPDGGEAIGTDTVFDADTTIYAHWQLKGDSGFDALTDVESGDWFYDDVRYVYEKGLMVGLTDTTFDPQLTTSRAQIVTILYRLEGEPNLDGENLGYPFYDVNANAYYADAVYWARLNGIVNGYSDAIFAPNDAVTREQMAAIFHNYARYKNEDVSASGNLSQFTDAADISDWASDALSWAVGSGLLGGKGDGTLDPQGSTTRAETAAILHRYIG